MVSNSYGVGLSGLKNGLYLPNTIQILMNNYHVFGGSLKRGNSQQYWFNNSH